MMKSNPIAVMTLALLTLVAGAICANAQQRKDNRAEALATVLGLNNQQADEVRKIYSEFDAKLDPVEERLWTAHQEARAQMEKLLNDQQRAKAPEIMKEEKEKELQKIGTRIGLNEQKMKQVEATMTQFHNKFKELASQNSPDVSKQFRELKHEMCATLGKELTPEEQVRLQGAMREEFHHWTQPAFRRAHVRAIEDKLGLSADQKTQADKIVADCERTSEKPLAQLKELNQQEMDAIQKVLTAEQRTKLQELTRERRRNE